MKDVVVHTPNSISERTNLFNAPRKLARSIWVHRSLIVQMTRREVTGRYKGSLLGLAWSFFNPLLMLVIYTFFFSVIFNARWGTDAPGGKAAFAIILFSGLIMHAFLAECINRAPGLIVGNVNYVKRVVFPLEILTLISMGSALFHAAISLLALFAAQLAFMQEMHWTVVFLPLVMLPLVLAAMGLSWILASLGVFVRDVGQMTGTAMTILLFLSPVFYPISALPEKYRGWLMLNPLTFIIENARKVIVFGTYPDFRQLLVGTVIAGVVAIFGFWWFQKTRKGFADVL